MEQHLLLLITCLLGSLLPLSGGDETFQCPGEGIYADPTDCHNFYSCDSNLHATQGSCFSGVGSFDIETNMCTILNCTPTDPPVETPAQGEFSCPDDQVGVFPDPLDCTSYYICYTVYLHRHYTCKRGRYDPPSNGCLFESC
ncbi:uncharacterized protein [Periplaneta americana]|uniref:uncharacterized protein n=1 Tax=Periplaneta americana TaxID=6978 RepID=UPI0037E73C66